MDKSYWEGYYLNYGQNNNIQSHSTFAKFCQEYYFISKKKKIVELGSGNGRDAIYFAHKGHNVVAIDQCTSAIEIEKKKIVDDVAINLNPIACDFVAEKYGNYKPIDVFYSRFTMHAITKKNEDELIIKVFNALRQDGLFCIEARTTKDKLCGKGESVGENTYKSGHYRRFIESQVFLTTVMSLGFQLLFFTEDDNLSICGDDNPVLMRLILQKV